MNSLRTCFEVRAALTPSLSHARERGRNDSLREQFSLDVNDTIFVDDVTSLVVQGSVTIPAVKNGGVLYLNQTFNVVVSNNNDNKSVIIETTATTDPVTGDLVISDPSIAIGLDCFVSYWQDSPTLALVEPSVTSV